MDAATVDSSQGAPVEQSDAMAREDASPDARVPEAIGSVPECFSIRGQVATMENRAALCRASSAELAAGGSLILYCSCDVALCKEGADGVPDRSCAQRVEGKTCEQAILSACGVRAYPGASTIDEDGGSATNDT